MHSPRQRTLRAHAKVNLLLRILNRDTGGYHGIETLFQRLALHDIVHVALQDDTRSLECDGPAMPASGLGAARDNLAFRAATAYTQAAAWNTGWHIAIEKHIPVGGGLGGGSADAAAVLRAMEAMSPHPLGDSTLMELAGALGADVPFLLSDAPRALAWHRGDRFVALRPLPATSVTLVTFPDGVHTGAAYRTFADARERAGDVPVSRAYSAATFDDWAGVAAVAANDFERVVPSMHAGVAAALPVLKAIAARLSADGALAIGLLSGSGATCFLLHPPEAALLLDAAMLPDGARLVVTETL